MIFRPKYRRQNKRSVAYLNDSQEGSINYLQFANTNIESTSSFRYGDKPYLVSSQQLRVDWSKFENHTFFHSAVSKVNEAFDRIVNFYPYEKSQKDIEVYEDSLTGFEKYVLDSFPKNVGYLNFSGTMVGEDKSNGNFIDVIDRSGANLTALSDRLDGLAVLDPITAPFSFEFFIKIPTQANDNQIVIQKFSSIANNLTIALSQSSDISKCDLHFGITSGSNYLHVTSSIDKGVFSHVTAMYDKLGDKRAKLLVNNNQVISSSNQVVFNRLDYNAANLTIGTGETARVNNTIFTQKQTFSGSMDDLRFFHSVNLIESIKKYKLKSYYPSENNPTLKLYYRFNEPPGSHTGNDIVLDASGNSLHSRVENFINHNRVTGSDVPVLAEDKKRNPVLFPTFSTVQTLNTSLLHTASIYDDFNPNIVTKLVPHHYFQDGTNFREFQQEIDALGEAFSTMSDSNVGKQKTDLPSSQTLIKLLLTYAKFYDELKMFVDAITSYNYTQYNDYDTTPDVFLKEKANKTNTILPDFFAYANFAQLLDGVNVNNSPQQSAKSLYEIQNLIWRRVLSEAPKNNLKRGTVDSLKSIFRQSGIEPDNILHFREYGGSKIKSLEGSVENRKDVFSFLNFSDANKVNVLAYDSRGYPTTQGAGYLKSGFLSGSRIETGVPAIRGSFVSSSIYPPHGISNNSSDGLFTSGSFTYEGLYSWPSGYLNVTESLARFHVTGTSAPSSTESCILNLVGSSESLSLYISDSPTNTTARQITLDGVNVFDKDHWYISFGKKDCHDFTTGNSGSYFLRASKQLNGDIIESHSTASFFSNYGDSVLKNISVYNTSGSFITIGSQSFQSTSKFLNANTTARSTTKFSGMITNMRFFSKNTSVNEWKNRTRNLSSFGVDNPLVNYNFNRVASGSFERLILQTDTKQNTKATDGLGSIRIFDFSQNNLHFEGSNFATSSASIFTNKNVNFDILSDKFDVNYAKQKVRIRSFQDSENIENGYFSTIAPVHEVLYSEETVDDNRLSIDMSSMKGLNENILAAFSDLSFLDDALGNPNLLFGESYFDLRAMREVYFNNLLEKINLKKYRELFKWIDSSFTDSIYSMIPKQTNFLGINFIYESHVLERHRFKYLYDEIYMKSLERDPARGNIFLSQFVGNVKKH